MRCIQGGLPLFCGSVVSFEAAVMLLLYGLEGSLGLDDILVTAVAGAQKLGCIDWVMQGWKRPHYPRLASKIAYQHRRSCPIYEQKLVSMSRESYEHNFLSFELVL